MASLAKNIANLIDTALNKIRVHKNFPYIT